jgi:uncharacterized protein
MKFENAFEVQAPIEQVWAALLDVERVAPCMPGAEVLERVNEDTYKVGIRVKVGPIAMTYRGDMQIGERDETARTATMHAKAKEARGQGTADARIQMSLTEEAGGTLTRLETDVQLSGRVAAMGQGVLGDVSAKLVETFAANLATMLEQPPPTDVDPASPPSPAVDPAAPPVAADGAQASAVAATSQAATGGERPVVRRSVGTAQSTLPVGKIAAGVIAGRLANPRTLLTAALSYAIVWAAIGFVIGRLV